MIVRLRRVIAGYVATWVTILTLGRVHVNPSGLPGAEHEQDDPDRPVVSRALHDDEPASRRRGGPG